MSDVLYKMKDKKFCKFKLNVGYIRDIAAS